MDELANFFAQHRRLLAALVILVTAGAAVGLTRVRIDSDPRAMLNAQDRISGPLQRLNEDFDAGDRDCVIVFEGIDFITPQGVSVVKQVAEGVERLAGIRRVTSMLNIRGKRSRLGGRYIPPLIPPSAEFPESWFETARADAVGHPLLARLLSDDRRTTLVVAALDSKPRSDAELRELIESIEQVADEATAGTAVTAGLTGLPVLRLEMIGSLIRDQKKFNITAMCAAGGVCFLIFRSLLSTMMIMLASSTGVIWTLGAMGWMGVPINMITSVIAPLVLVIGVSDAIHLHLEMRRAKSRGAGRLEAAQIGIRHVGPACALTSLTTFVGFGSLLLASLDVIRVFGAWSALGCVLNYVAVIIVLPLLSSVFPERALVGEFRFVGLAASRLSVLLNQISRWRWTVVVTAVALTGGLFYISLTLRAENRLTETIPLGQPAYQALQTCDAKFGGAMVASVLIEVPTQSSAVAAQADLLPVLKEVHAAIDRQRHIHHPTSLLSLLQSLPDAGRELQERVYLLQEMPKDVVRQFINASATRALVDARIPDVGSRTLLPEFEALQREFDELAEQYPGYSIELTGGSVLSIRNLRLVVRDLWSSLSAAAIVIIVVLTLVFRSPILGIISAIPNVFPLVSAAAALVLLGRPLEVSSVVVFSMCLGIATDDTIHFLARYRLERSQGVFPAAAVRAAIEVVGEAILVTTILLTIGFGSFWFSLIPALQNVGELACISLTAALIGDLIILPSLLLVAYDRPEP